MFKVSNRNTKTSCEICSKLTIKILERRHSKFSSRFFKGHPISKASSLILLRLINRKVNKTIYFNCLGQFVAVSGNLAIFPFYKDLSSKTAHDKKSSQQKLK